MTSTRAIFSLCIFTGSFLLFMVQPMVGKIVLPTMGGSSAVWTTCMLFFQLALLCGYLYAQKTADYLGTHKQALVHIMLLAGAYMALPLDFVASDLEGAHRTPVIWLVTRLTASIGFLFVISAANAPILQRWYSQTRQSDSDDPYFLYSASNVGSLMALLSYPFLVEPLISLSQQKLLWSAVFSANALMVMFCSIILWQNPEPVAKSMTYKACSWTSALKWLVYGFVPCSAMLGVTTHITTDVASGPLLWVFPLSIYLVSFVLVFSRSEYWRNIRWERYVYPATLLILAMYYMRLTDRTWFAFPLHLSYLFVLCMHFHALLARSRPEAAQLNTFYVWMSAGGIAGGVFNGVVAPVLFKTQFEYVFVMIISALAVTWFADKDTDADLSFVGEMLIMLGVFLPLAGFARLSLRNADMIGSNDGLISVLIMALCLQTFFRFRKIAGTLFLVLLMFMQAAFINRDNVIFIDRSFFGILSITAARTDGYSVDPDLKIEGVEDVFYSLNHGTTLHGVERKVEVRPIFPLAYYSKEGPAGMIFRAGRINRQFADVGIIGLGCGTLAWFGRPWQQFDFFEIDPLIAEVAKNPSYFTYLERSAAHCNVILGDGRVSLQSRPDNYYDLLILDAYSSDSVPVHLLTLEAVNLYLKKLKPGGVIAFHLSNRYFRLGPVVARICAELGLMAYEIFDDPDDYSVAYDWYDEEKLSSSYWVIVSSDYERVKDITRYGNWSPMHALGEQSLWTDDYANLMSAYKWR